jgi:hypothetical protein
MYRDDMTIGAWVSLSGQCPVRYTVNDRDNVEVAFRTGSNTFHLALDGEALESLVRVATDALREMDELRSSSRRVHPPANLRSRRWGSP